MINLNNASEPVKDFKEWLNKGGDLIEKIVSIVVLLTEIILLFFHNVNENVSFYLFTGLNFCFSVFIWYTFIKRRNNIFYTLDEEFGITDKYLSKLKPSSINDELNNDKKTNEEIYNDSFKREEAIEGNLLIKQFSYVRYSWLFTAVLYIIIIINHILFNNDKGDELVYLRPWLSGAIIMVNLLSTYFYLVAYQVMYYSPIQKPQDKYANKKIDEIPQYLHIKKTSWWFGVMFSILIAYIFSYNYFKSENKNFSNTLLYENSKSIDSLNRYNELRITGDKISILNGHTPFLNDPEENMTFYIGSSDYRKNNFESLKITIDQFHKKSITLIDTIHTNFIIEENSNKNLDGKLIIKAIKKNATIHFKANKKIDNIEFVVRDDKDNSNGAVDFVFQFATGLLSALIMCFFVGRFESMTFQTPPWILIILYFYAVIQGFLVILNVDFIKENEFLISAHDKISKFVFFIALLGKVVLYTYIIGLFSTKRLFYYFIETKRERENMEKKWKNAWNNITERKLD